jgi:DNA-binding MarR family transcriptional regulator
VSTGPLIGALFRRAHEQARRFVMPRLVEAGFTDLRPSDFVMLQYPPADGVSPSVFAAQRGLSKQALNHLLGTMEARGYFERRPDPDDRRGTLIVPTRRGRALLLEVRSTAEAFQRRCLRTLGAARFRQLRRALEELDGAQK